MSTGVCFIGSVWVSFNIGRECGNSLNKYYVLKFHFEKYFLFNSTSLDTFSTLKAQFAKISNIKQSFVFFQQLGNTCSKAGT